MSPTGPARDTIFFDLDGTLVDTIALIVASHRHALTQVLGADVAAGYDDAVLRSWIGRPLTGVFAEADPDRAEALHQAYQEWNLANTSRLIAEYPGIDGMLARLAEAGIPTGVVTSKARSMAELALREVGLDGAIDVVGAREDSSEHKPDPTPLLVAARRRGVEATRCTYVGDAVVDVRAARAAGMRAVAVTWGAAPRADLEAAHPELMVDTVEDLSAALLAD